MKILRYFLSASGVFLFLLLMLFVFWRMRPNESQVDHGSGIETWAAVFDGTHNSNTDMIMHNGMFYMVHASSPYHFASDECRLIVRRSADAVQWEKIAKIKNPGEDIRDPKMLSINGRIIMYVLRNRAFTAEPYDTYYTTSSDGINWEPIKPVGHEGWLFWRPKSPDGKTWYLPAYWWQHGKSQLLKSMDGISWDFVSFINKSETIPGDYNDETAIEFMPDGRMISTARIEMGQDLSGHPEGHTLISVSAPPYTEWTSVKSSVTRLDGPALFSHKGSVFAVGRRHTENSWPKYHGSIYSRYRTALFRVLPDRLVHITDFPSAGDTSYGGVVIKENFAYSTYYTSNVEKDYPWILGMVLASDIRIAKIPLEYLEKKSK